MNTADVAVSIAKITGKVEPWVDNSLQVSLGDGTQIFVEYLPESGELYVYGHVATISEERFGRYALFLLKANHFGKETGGSAVLAYDADEGKVVIWDRIVLSAISDEEFRERFCLIYLSKLYWANKMHQELLGGDYLDIASLPAIYTS